LIKVVRQRLLDFVPVLVLSSVAVFGLLYVLPGDPATAMLSGSGASAELIEQLRQEMGLRDPLPVQYWRFVSRALTGDLGHSVSTRRAVGDMLRDALPHTAQLALGSITLALVIGIPLGIVAAVYRNSWVDRLSMLISLGGISLPQFWLGLVLIFIFSFRLGWVPATGQGGFSRLILPVIVLGYGSASVIARMVRSSMLEVLRLEFITAARGKGVAEFYVIMRHAFRNAAVPVVTMIGLQVGWLLGGAVIVETVFSRPGLGRVLVEAIQHRDFPVVQGVILVITLTYLVINLLTDISYGLLDPRIRQ
jgi:ABC-type dipeptide/oligopeptide/nickel transport system permease component